MSYQLIIDQAGEAGYTGRKERCTYEFRVPLPEQLGAGWLMNIMVNKHTEELANQNSRLLRMRVWENIAPTWHTDYKVEVTATASPLYWNIIIIGVLFAITLFFGWQIFQIGEEVVEVIAEEGVLPEISMATLVAIVLIVILLLRRKRLT